MHPQRARRRTITRDQRDMAIACAGVRAPDPASFADASTAGSPVDSTPVMYVHVRVRVRARVRFAGLPIIYSVSMILSDFTAHPHPAPSSSAFMEARAR